MSSGRFGRILILLVLLSLAVLYILNRYIPEMGALSPFALITLVVFVFVVVAAYYLGMRTARSASRSRFVQLVMGLIVFKMLLCFLLIAAHVEVAQPNNKLFVIPFLLIYLIFTIFEVYVLERLARLKPRDTSGNS